MEGLGWRRSGRISGLVLMGALVFGASGALAQNPPASVSPGGVQPQLEQRDRAFSDRQRALAGPTVEIPAVLDRPLPLDGPQIVVSRFDLRLPPDWQYAPVVPVLEELLQQKVASQPAAGYYIAELEEIAGEVTAMLREEGFIVSRAYLPTQDVRGGAVRILVLAGRLGEVKVEGNERYSLATIARPFDALEGEPLELKRLESALLRLNDYPGLVPFGVLSPGSALGETDLTVRVGSEDAIDLSITSNNYGNEFTGQYQASAELAWYNPTGAADVLRLRLLQSFDPTNSLYGSFYYQRPLPLPGLSIGGGFFTNSYDVGGDFVDSELEGDSLSGNVFLNYEFLRQRSRSAYGRLSLARKATEVRERGDVTAEDDLTVASAEVGFTIIDRFNGSSQLAVTYDRGFNDLLGALDATGDDGTSSRSSVFGEPAAGKFEKVTVRFSRLQRLTENQSLLLRGYYQHSDDLLVSLEQLSLGGPFNVRAFPVSEELVDKGGFFTAEWVIRAPGFAKRPAWGGRSWGEVFGLSLFYDYAGGRIVDPFDNPAQGQFETTDLSGVGVGLDFRFTRNSQLRIDISTALSDSPQAADDPQVFAYFYFGLK